VPASLGNRLAAVEASNRDGFTGRCVQALTLVDVDQLRDQQALGRPLLDGAGTHAEDAGHLLQRQHALAAQAGAAVIKMVPRAELPDDEGAELVPYARSQTTGVQDVGDFGVGVTFQEAIDLGDHRGISPPQLIGGFWSREPTGMR
jgi:hypothetical protein